MSRSDYDDMPSSFSRKKRGGGRKSYIFALMGVLIILIILIFMMVFRDDGEKNEEPKQETSINLNVPEVEEVEVMVPPLEEKEEEETVRKEIPEEIPEPEEEKAEEEMPSPYKEYIVSPSDTLSSIASEAGITADTLASLNRIHDQADLTEGMSLWIPPTDGRLYQKRNGDTLDVIMKRFAVELSKEEFMALNMLAEEDISSKEWFFIPQEAEENRNPFIRPCFGDVDMVFGETWKDERLEGVTFTLTPGAAVVAIADGIVTDAGTDRELGRFITLMHDDGYRSTYYCLEMTNVKLGQTVKKGDVIATVGSSSRYFGPARLYFTLNQGPVTLDPLLFF